MSLILESLQKLETDLKAAPSGPGGTVSEQVPATRQMLRWLCPIIVGLMLVLALGCGAVYAVQYLKERIPTTVEETPLQEQRREVASPVPANDPVMDAKPATVEEPGSPPPGLKPEEENHTVSQVQYYPPASEKSSPALPSTALVGALAPAVSEIEPEAAATPRPLKASEPDRVHTTRPPKVPVQAQPAYDAELEAAEQARRAALEKSARIARLVRNIEQALAGSPEAGNPQILMAKLARIKGNHHPYVAKLRAYWNFQRGKYDLAEFDLKNVIAANPEDLEAGINLALIEIHDQRYHEAMARLKQLRHTYPENPQIADLIKRLR
jgi:hypothetical protein